jgi:hypothetical protein
MPAIRLGGLCEFEEAAMDGGVGGEFGMECGGHHVAFLDERGLVGEFGKDLDAFADALENWGADENHFERFVVESCFAGDDVAVDLAAVAVAEDGQVEEAEGILFWIFYLGGEQDCAGAGAENWAIVGGEFADGVVEAFFLEELELGGAFAAGEDEAVAALQVGGGADLDGFGAQIGEHSGVGCEVTLDCEDSDFQAKLQGEKELGDPVGVFRFELGTICV